MIGASAAFQQAVQQATQVARSDAGRPAHRRVGHRQGTAGRAHPSREPVCRGSVREGELRGDSDRAHRERAVRTRERRVHRRGRDCGAASSSWPTAGRSFWTKSATCTRRRRRSCCGFCRTANSSGSAASRRFACRVRVDLGHESPARRADRAPASSARICIYRLSVVPIRVPALRERRGRHSRAGAVFPRRSSARATTSGPDDRRDVLPMLERYHWPGNVRELRNVVERMAILTTGDAHQRRRDPARDPAAAGAARRRPAGRPRRRRARSHPPGARADRLERLGCRAAARDRADQPAQADQDVGAGQEYLIKNGTRRAQSSESSQRLIQALEANAAKRRVRTSRIEDTSRFDVSPKTRSSTRLAPAMRASPAGPSPRACAVP